MPLLPFSGPMPRGVQAKIDPLGRGKKLLLLSPEDQKLVQEFISFIGTLGRRRIEKYEAYVGKIGFELNKPFERARACARYSRCHKVSYP